MIRLTTIAIIMFVFTAPAIGDDAPPFYKMVVKDRALYGTRLDSKRFLTCGGVVIEPPSGARVERASGACPADPNDIFVPHSGHTKLVLPRLKASAAPLPRPS